MTLEILITIAGYGAAIFAIACAISLVAMAADRWPRYVKQPIENLWVLVQVMLFLPLGIFVWLLDRAGNSPVRQVVYCGGYMVLLWALGVAIGAWLRS